MKYTFKSDFVSYIAALEKSALLNRFIPCDTLKVRQYAKAVILPSKGVYSDGTFLPESQWGGQICGNNILDFSKISNNLRKSDETVYYIGTFHPCWGHDITDGTRLLWGLIPQLGGIKLDNDVKYAYSLCDLSKPLSPNFKSLLSYLGIDDSNLLLVSEPTQFKSVYLAEESYWYDINTEEKRTFSTTYQNFFEVLCKRVVPVKSEPSRTMYFSRTAWHKGNPDFGERYIEKAFQKQWKCEIFHPEQLSFGQMVEILQETKTLITTEGSISHNALFMQPGTNLVIIRKAGFISYYQLMVNQLKDLNVTYIDAHYTTKFYNEQTPYYGPFFLLVNKQLADFLGIKPHFPIVSYMHYRFHVVKTSCLNKTISFLAKIKHSIFR